MSSLSKPGDRFPQISLGTFEGVDNPQAVLNAAGVKLFDEYFVCELTANRVQDRPSTWTVTATLRRKGGER